MVSESAVVVLLAALVALAWTVALVSQAVRVAAVLLVRLDGQGEQVSLAGRYGTGG